ncbi:Uncharacterised protein [Serratia fonticola]|nr:Uncharacterised protein [Serratia fonticola]CAI1032887.1 Uncharacterised protein [Serratia fonticola]
MAVYSSNIILFEFFGLNMPHTLNELFANKKGFIPLGLKP